MPFSQYCIPIIILTVTLQEIAATKDFDTYEEILRGKINSFHELPNHVAYNLLKSIRIHFTLRSIGRSIPHRNPSLGHICGMYAHRASIMILQPRVSTECL